MYTNTTAPVTIICSECGEGHYLISNALQAWASCTDCEHRVNIAMDIRPNLEAGESLTVDAGYRLAYLPAED